MRKFISKRSAVKKILKGTLHEDKEKKDLIGKQNYIKKRKIPCVGG
jgi:hypothetical protein